MSAIHNSSCCPCIPDTSGKTAMAAIALILIAGTPLATLILLQDNPSLNTIFYTVFATIGGLAFLIFVVAVINMCKGHGKKETHQKNHTSSQDTQMVSPTAAVSPPVFTPMPFIYPPMYQHPSMMYHPSYSSLRRELLSPRELH